MKGPIAMFNEQVLRVRESFHRYRNALMVSQAAAEFARRRREREADASKELRATAKRVVERVRSETS